MEIKEDRFIRQIVW